MCIDMAQLCIALAGEYYYLRAPVYPRAGEAIIKIFQIDC